MPESRAHIIELKPVKGKQKRNFSDQEKQFLDLLTSMLFEQLINKSAL